MNLDASISRTQTADICYEAWIGHKDIGISELIFGVPKEVGTLRGFINSIEEFLEEYEQRFAEKYCQG